MSTTEWSRTAGSLPNALMSLSPIEKSHAELAALAERIRKHDAEASAIDRDLAAAIERARTEARLTMLEIAADVGVERTTLYSSLRRAKAQAIKGRPGPLRSNASQK